jgi:hypothetical protein
MTPNGAAVTDPPLPGSIHGTVGDRSGAVVAGARVRLTREDQVLRDQASKDQALKDHSPKDQSQKQEVLSDGNGQFSFANVGPGAFQLTITATGFATQTSSGILHAGEIQAVPQIALDVATAVTDVQVSLTRVEVAEEEIKIEEKQRVLGVIPNFYVSYIADAVPLTSKQKFNLACNSAGKAKKPSSSPKNNTALTIPAVAGTMKAWNAFSSRTSKPSNRGCRVCAASREIASRNFNARSAGAFFRPTPESNCCVRCTAAYSCAHPGHCSI